MTGNVVVGAETFRILYKAGLLYLHGETAPEWSDEEYRDFLLRLAEALGEDPADVEALGS